MRSLALALTLAVVALALRCGGSTADEAPGACGPGDPCVDGQVCVAARCFDELGDDDRDGLPNGVEARWGLDLFSDDSDADGLADADELGDWEHPVDNDADGLPDAVEHDLLDADRDCLPAPLDPDETLPETSPGVLVAALCRHAGVCAGGAAVTVTCQEGAFACDYARVAGFEDVEDRCDGLDNDCDGLVDEGAAWNGLPLGDACRGEGACGWGVVECRVDGGVACSSNPDGSAPGGHDEACNGQDDDCDGLTDEDLAYHDAPVGGACHGEGACGAGVVECVGGAPACSTDPGGSTHGDGPELCNGQDDDCDGLTDEDLTGPVIDNCPVRGVCASAFDALAVVCADGHWQCDFSAVPAYEEAEASCDGLDNDCDGLTDSDVDGGCP